MNFKCTCGEGYYQIFRTRRTWNGTYVTNDNFPGLESKVNFDFDMENITDEWTAQCEFCNKTWGPTKNYKQLVGILKRDGVLK